MSNRFALLIALELLYTGGVLSAAEPLQTWQIDGVERQGLVYAPASATTQPAPVLFAFHGHGGNMRQAAREFGYQTLWPEAIVVYLQGLNTPGQLTDPDGKRAGWQAHSGDQGDRDLKLFDAALAWAKKTYKVDDRRIYCAGHSNGGGFTYLLWDQRPNVFAAVAPASAAALTLVKDFKPMPILVIGGRQDPLVKFQWQESMIEAVRKLDGCDAQGKAAGKFVTVYPSASGTPVETYLYDGGHMVPPEAWPEVVKFFKEHPAS